MACGDNAIVVCRCSVVLFAFLVRCVVGVLGCCVVVLCLYYLVDVLVCCVAVVVALSMCCYVGVVVLCSCFVIL